MPAARAIKRGIRERMARDGVVLSQAERLRRTAQAVAADPARALCVEVSAVQDEVRYLEKLLADAEQRLAGARAQLHRFRQEQEGGSAIWGTPETVTV